MKLKMVTDKLQLFYIVANFRQLLQTSACRSTKYVVFEVNRRFF